MKHKSLVLLAFVLTVSPLLADEKDRMLFKFDKPEAAKPWQTVNDGVMGGRSDGRFKINEDKKMEFFGTLSLENNGGFASVRARGAKLAIEKGDVIVARVRGVDEIGVRSDVTAKLVLLHFFAPSLGWLNKQAGMHHMAIFGS